MRAFLTLLCSVFVCLGLTGAAFGQSAPEVSEGSLRKMAIKTVMPTYPADSIKRGSTGVSVSQLIFDEAGVVIKVDILEAPDKSISDEIKKALQQWTFKPTRWKDENGPPTKIQGKLTFYFVIEKGQARVENPKQFK